MRVFVTVLCSMYACKLSECSDVTRLNVKRFRFCSAFTNNVSQDWPCYHCVVLDNYSFYLLGGLIDVSKWSMRTVIGQVMVCV